MIKFTLIVLMSFGLLSASAYEFTVCDDPNPYGDKIYYPEGTTCDGIEIHEENSEKMTKKEKKALKDD
jgi:cytochrome oxidase Cu insertion factor (SCO1/SenC/PrrC family)